MDAIATLVRLGFAALISAAVAGLLLVLAMFFAAKLDDPLTVSAGIGWTELAELWPLLSLAVPMGIFVAGLPAFLAGATMWGIGRHRPGARRALAWAGAGASVGALFWALFELTFWTPGRSASFSGLDAAFFLACPTAGAGAALAFRAAMAWTRFMEE